MSQYHKSDDELCKRISAATGAYVRKAYRQSAWGKPGQDNIIVELDDDGATFAVLSKMSDYFQTKDINLGSEVREGGYCETCAYSYSVAIVTIMNAKEPDETPVDAS